MKTDYGKDLPPVSLAVAHRTGLCPRCGMTATDLRGTSASQFTLDAAGKCYWNGEQSHGFVCNKAKREARNGTYVPRR